MPSACHWIPVPAPLMFFKYVNANTMNCFSKRDCRGAHRQGFALIIAIMLMGFLLLLSVSLASLTMVESNAASTGADADKARKHAFLGLMVALGRLQEAAGPDRRAMAIADGFDNARTGAEQWLGVWDTSSASATPVWLVSGNAPDPAADFANKVTLVDKVLGDSAPDSDKVQVQLVQVPEGQGNFGWWVSDQSMKANVRDGWVPDQGLSAFTITTDSKPDSVKRNIARRVPMRRSAEMIMDGVQPDDSHAGGLQNALSLPQLGGLPGLTFRPGESFHDVTLFSYGLLTNPSTGGFKYNLTGANSDPHGFLNPSLTAFLRAERDNNPGTYNVGTGINTYTGTKTFTTGIGTTTKPDGTLFEPDPVLVITPPATSNGALTPMFPPLNASKEEGYGFYSPILTEFLFRFSFVMAEQANPNVKANFYIRPDFIYELWNPYPFTLELTRQEGDATLAPLRIMVTNFEPTITISLFKGGATKADEFSVDLSTDTTGEFSQSIAIPPYIERFYPIVNGRRPDGPAILYPGESYAGRSPFNHWNPTTFPGSLTLNTAHNWYYPPAGTNTALTPAPNGGQWLEDTDSVNIEVAGTFSLSILPRPYDRNFNGSNLTHTLIHITNIPFNALVEDLPVSGNPRRFYYANSIASLTRDKYQMAIWIRLLDGLDNLQELAERMDPRKRTIDWSEISDLYWREEFFDGRNDEFTTFDGNDLFRHDSDQDYGPESYRFSSYDTFLEKSRFVKLFDVPTVEPVSLDVFRSAYFVDMPAFSFGEPQSGNTGTTLNAAFDRYFMSGITPAWTPTIQQGRPASAMPNPNLVFSDWNRPSVADAAELRSLLAGQGAAEQLLVGGSFDVNSLSVAAWAAVLASPQYVADDMKTARVGVILHMPHQPLTDAMISDALTDSQLGQLSGQTLRNALFTQTVRVLDNPIDTASGSSLLYKLAEALVTEIKEWQEQKKRPFYSMEEFANSGVIKRALEQSDINKIGSVNIPALSPLYIGQSKIMGIISNFANVRGDTFLIRSYGDTVDPNTGTIRATAMCEAIVQRLPGYVDASNDPDTATSVLNAENQRFGRRFHVVAFGWLDADER